jgi:MFS family permease
LAALLAAANLLFVALRLRETLPATARAQEVRWRDRIAVLGVLSLKGGALRRVNLVSWLYLLAFAAMEFTLGFLLAGEPFNLGPKGIAGVLVFVGFMLILTQGLLVRRLVPKLGEARSARIGLALVTGGLAVLAWAPTLPWIFVAQAFTAMGAGLSNASLATLASLYASSQEQGRVSGLFRSLGSLSRATGPLLGGFLFWSLGSGWTYGLAAVLVTGALLLAWTLPAPSKTVEHLR